MGVCRKLFLAVIVVAIAFAYQAYRDLANPLPLPDLGKDERRFFLVCLLQIHLIQARKTFLLFLKENFLKHPRKLKFSLQAKKILENRWFWSELGIFHYIFDIGSLKFFSPLVDLNEYWGRGDSKSYKEDKTIKPFKISYSAEVGRRLRKAAIFMNIY